MVKKLLCGIALVVILAGCATYRKVEPAHMVKGDNVVCILFEDSRFKDLIIENLTTSLTGKGYEVIADRRKNSEYYDSADYGAVVYMTEYWVFHTPWHAKKYYRKNNNAGNIIFVVTSAYPGVVIKKPFDAVTSPSKTERVEPVVREIMDRLDSILWK